jgi:opacity protein-like surface antigen
MKKFFIAALLSCFSMSSVSYAQPDLYAGIGGGVNIFTPKRKVVDVIDITPPIDVPPATKFNQDSGVGANLSVFVGVKESYNQFSLAGELSAGINSGDAEAKIYNYAQLPNTAISRIKNKGNFTASVLPGYYINNNTEGFLRLGFSRGRFEAKSSAQTGGDLIATGRATRWLSGYVFGAGMETKITPCISLRLEYDYSQYQSFSQTSQIPSPINLNNDIITSTITPRNHLVTLNVVFHNFM